MPYISHLINILIERLQEAGPLKIVVGLAMIAIFLVILIRILFMLLIFILTIYYRKYKSYLFKSGRKNPEDKKPNPTRPMSNRDILSKDKQVEDAAIVEVQRMGVNADEQSKEIVARSQRVVDVVKPVGVWTARILGDRMSYLVSVAKNSQLEGGFWVNLVKANSMLYQGKGNERAMGR